MGTMTGVINGGAMTKSQLLFIVANIWLVQVFDDRSKKFVLGISLVYLIAYVIFSQLGR
jgi:hypothetical protein